MAKTNVNTAITGKSGKGKSWYEGFLIEQSNKPRVIFDKKDEQVGLAQNVVRLTRERWTAMSKNPYASWRNILESYPNVRITTKGLTPQDLRDAAASCARVVHEKGRMLWVGTEYHNIAPNGGSMGDCPEDILVLHTDARTCEVDIFFDSQRPALVDTTIMSQANRRVGFGMDDPNDIKRTAGYFASVRRLDLEAGGIHVPGDSDLVPARDLFPYMPPRRCLHLDCDTGEQVLVDTSKLTRKTQHNG